MDIQLLFSKSDDAPWGFRLTGGADCEVPLTVIKKLKATGITVTQASADVDRFIVVTAIDCAHRGEDTCIIGNDTDLAVTEGGIAEDAGLQVGDVVNTINERRAEDLSHIEAHDVLMESGQNFTMTVIRDQESAIHDDEYHNEEVRNILETSSNHVMMGQHNLQSAINQNRYSAYGAQNDSVSEQTISSAKSNNEDRYNLEDLQETELQLETTTQCAKQNKWSTFLQKPDRPIVPPKKRTPTGPVAEPYRVIITKQPKKTAKEIERKRVGFVEEEPSVIPLSDDVYELPQSDEDELRIEEKDEEEFHEYEEDISEQEPSNIEEVHDEDEVSDQNDEQDEESRSVEEEIVDLGGNASLEEQLAQIQQQLQALSQLPTSIQDNLEAVTKQLAKIVGVPQSQKNLEQDTVQDDQHYTEEEVYSDNDDNLASIIEESAEEIDSNDEYKLDAADTTDASEEEDEDDSQVALRDIELDAQQKAEAEQEKLIELEKYAKLERQIMQTEEFHQRRLEQRPTNPLAPIQRPIILPGGRKWSEPDDALPKPRKSKMTDEKICETLDNYSEIIAGHTKGINFLKYQPAPKNLDYLQRSEVFRLVHDMDPPKTGIAARSGVVVSEEDYYQNKPFDVGHHATSVIV